ncbi:MAG: LPS assembly protein LptD [Candidatus Omnitrophota bacterium]
MSKKYNLKLSDFIIIFSLFIFNFSLTCSLSYAEEARPIEVNGDNVEYLFSEKKVIGKGNISVDYGDMLLTCDSIIVHTDSKEALAEGNVLLKSDTSEIKGEKVRYNFETRVGELLKVRVKSGDWYGGGEKGEFLSDGTLNIEGGYITSCDLDEPHYKISSKKIIIYPDNQVVAKDVTFKAGKIPVMYLPRYNYSMNGDWPTFNFIPGRKEKWGAFLLTSYRYDMNKDSNVTLRIDERENWGLGEGIDYKYKFFDNGQGLIRTYYTHQRDRDRGEPVRAEEERYRAQIRHSWDITDKVSALAEYHKMSDVSMTKDFFYREEYERESSPESYLYLLDRDPEYALSFLARKRVNRFQSVTEKLPELRFDLKDQELLNKVFYFKTDTFISNLNGKTANSDTDTDAVRIDSYNKVSSPLRLADILSITPFVGARNTFYSKNIQGEEDEVRAAFNTGIDISTKFRKTYNAVGKFLGVDFNKLHHIVTPTIEYEYIHEPSIVSGDLQQFDDTDALARKSTFSMGFQNQLQTKREIKGSLKTVDLGYLLITGDYLYKPENGSRLQNVKGDLELTPFDWLRLESDTQYNPSTRDFENWNVDLYIDKTDDVRIGFGSRYWQDEEHELTSELFYKLNNEWAVRLFGRFDLKEVESNGHKIINRFDNRGITIIKDLHCFIGEVSFDTGRDGGLTAWFSLKLKASPKVAFDFKDYYAAPKSVNRNP